jgi:SAM-dependent methyltransferase
MEARIYDDIALQENDHWWFCARRAVFRAIFSKLALPKSALILDAGCGTGGNLPLLKPFGTVYGFEMHAPSRALAQKRCIGQVENGMLPDNIPFSDTQFDMITLFDVLEHVEDDAAALRALSARLKPEGVIYLSVPAFQFLFGQMDVLHHHHRRYSKAQLTQVIQSAGLEIELINYWNSLLFPVALLARLYERILPPKGKPIGIATPPAPINTTLAHIVSLERFIVPHMRLPFGLSLLVLARKPR